MKNFKNFVALALGFALSTGSAWAFNDVTLEHPYAEAIMNLAENGIVQGYEDGNFLPDAQINRAELLKILVEGIGENYEKIEFKNCFPDVQEEWFAEYVCFAKSKSWIEGYPDGLFHPEQNVNRAESLKIIFNAFQLVPDVLEESPFEDVAIDTWFAPFVGIGSKHKLIPEDASNFAPAELRTRGEIAEIIFRTMKLNASLSEVWPKEWISAEQFTLKLMNELRAKEQKPALVLDPILSKAAREHSKDMAENLGKISHQGSDGQNSNYRITNSGLVFEGATAENLGAGLILPGGSIESVIESVHLNIYMKEADEGVNHKTTLLSKTYDFNKVGIGVYVKDEKVYFTVDFVAEQ